jgi:hypothetical protein
MTEFTLGEPVSTEFFGKPLHVEDKGDYTEIAFGDKTLILNGQSVLEGLADAIKWTAGMYHICGLTKKINSLRVKVKVINVEVPADVQKEYIHIDNEYFIVGAKGTSLALSFLFNQDVYIAEEAGDELNGVLFRIWRRWMDKGNKNELDLRIIEAEISNYIRQRFYEKKASYDRYDYEVYKKLTKSLCFEED